MLTMTSSAPHVAERSRSATQTIAVLALAHAALISVLLLMFAWPALTAEPRDVPIGIVGPAPLVEQVGERIDAQQEGALDLIAFDSPADAEQAIAEREIYGAIVLGEAPEALVASAASPAVAQLLSDLARAIVEASAAQAGIPALTVTVTDVAAFTEADSRGAVFGSFALPLVIGGISLAALAALRLSSARSRAAFIGIASITTGLALAGIMSGALGVLPGPFWLTALAISATLAALGYSLIGAHALAGTAGLATLAALLFLLGNPLNGVALPPEFYLGAWGTVGQLMPVGAGFDLLRSINFFESASTSTAWTVLVVWAGAGLAALVLGATVRRAKAVRS
jgi:hypothetical protein